MTIAVVFALEFEAATFIPQLGRRLNADVWVLGVTGSRAAEALDRRFARSRPSVVISAGFGGALVDDLCAGDIVVASNFSDPRLLAALSQHWRRGGLATSDSILQTAAEKLELGRSTGAIVGDMETAHLAGVCTAAGVPLLGVRAISDTATEDLPVPADALISPMTGRPDPAALFRHLFTHPKDALGFRRLLEAAHLARNNLTSALDTMVSELLRAPGF